MRHSDWPSRLARYIEKTREDDFQWGVNDCCLWACGGIAAMTGHDPAARFRGRYRSEFGARMMVQQFGGGLSGTIVRLTRESGFVHVSPLMAQRGDLMAAKGNVGWSHMLGLCVGRVAVFRAHVGLLALPLASAIKAWRV